MTATTLTKVRSVEEMVAERGAAYGPPSENHARTARFWSAYLLNRGYAFKPFTPSDVCFLNILQKISRCMGEAGPSQDSLQDIQGFAENLLTLGEFSDGE